VWWLTLVQLDTGPSLWQPVRPYDKVGSQSDRRITLPRQFPRALELRHHKFRQRAELLHHCFPGYNFVRVAGNNEVLYRQEQLYDSKLLLHNFSDHDELFGSEHVDRDHFC